VQAAKEFVCATRNAQFVETKSQKEAAHSTV